MAKARSTDFAGLRSMHDILSQVNENGICRNTFPLEYFGINRHPRLQTLRLTATRFYLFLFVIMNTCRAPHLEVSCVKVEVAVLGSSSLISLIMVSVFHKLMKSTALFSASEQTHCALVCDSERVTITLHSAFFLNIYRSGYSAV